MPPAGDERWQTLCAMVHDAVPRVHPLLSPLPKWKKVVLIVKLCALGLCLRRATNDGKIYPLWCTMQYAVYRVSPPPPRLQINQSLLGFKIYWVIIPLPENALGGLSRFPLFLNCFLAFSPLNNPPGIPPGAIMSVCFWLIKSLIGNFPYLSSL